MHMKIWSVAIAWELTNDNKVKDSIHLFVTNQEASEELEATQHHSDRCYGEMSAFD